MTPDVTWQPFDPQDPGSPPPALHGTGAVALVPSGGDPQWAAAAAVGLARTLARNGRRVFLCDADVEDPRLHGFFDGELGEGVSDLVLYGASPRRVAREVEDRLLFVPAGTTVADAARVHSSPRWDALVDAVAQADGVLLIHLPAGSDGSEALLARAEHVVVVGDPADAPELGEAADRLVLGLYPHDLARPGSEGAPMGAGAGVSSGVERPPVAAGETPAVHLTSGVEVETPTTAEGDVLDDPRVREAVARARARADDSASEGGGSRIVLLLLLVVVLALLAAAWLGFIPIPGITPAAAGTVDGAVVAAATYPDEGVAPGGAGGDERPGVRIVSPHHVWHLALGSYTDARAAAGMAERLDREHPDLAVVVAPVEVDGTVFHRVLAGPLADSTSAAALAAHLDGGAHAAADPVVRAAPLAFLVGEASERAAAQRRLQVLRELDLPAHLLSARRSDGSTLYRVYVGAYEGGDEAAWMASRLEERNVGNALLTERRGTPPA